MTLRDFDNGYWYAEELRAFAAQLEIPLATKLRKDQLEAALKNLLFADSAKAGNATKAKKSEPLFVAPKPGPRDLMPFAETHWAG